MGRPEKAIKKPKLNPEPAAEKKEESSVDSSKEVLDLTGKNNFAIKAVVVLPDGDCPPDMRQCKLCLGEEDDDVFLFHALVLQSRVNPSLADLQKAVGGLIAPVRPSKEIKRTGWRGMWVNEEGRLKDLPFNNNASSIALSTFTNPLVGRAVLCRSAN